MRREKVVVVGGGVAGLTAAHELIERGFDVHLYERRRYYGGKAASVRVGKDRLPGEHGFRFYPGWYRHLPDTMKRIPVRRKGRRNEEESVFDNLVTVDADLLTWFDREPLNVLMHLPQNAGQAKDLFSLAARMRTFGLAPGEVAYFFRKLVEFTATSDLRRAEVYDQITWWDFLEADGKSQAFRDLIIACTRNMVAAKATEASAFTIGKLALRTMLDGLSMVDRVLNGPTQETWIDPWREYLAGRGVCFHPDLDLESIEFKPGERKIDAVTFTSSVVQTIDRLTWLLRMIWPTALSEQAVKAGDEAHRALFPMPARRAPGCVAWKAAEFRDDRDFLDKTEFLAKPAPPTPSTALTDQIRQSCEAAIELAEWLSEQIDQPAPIVTLVARLRKIEAKAARGKLPDDQDDEKTVGDGRQEFYAGHERLAAARAEFGPTEVVEHGDHFLFALPVEQMAYYVNRSATMTHHDPTLKRIVLLAEHTDWMAGIQFFLCAPFDAVKGHVACMDSDWGLTAIEETQFWRDVDGLPSDVKSVISVDIASWDTKGRFGQREAFNCTNDEIASEVWSTLKACLNRDTKGQWLRDDMLRGSPTLKRNVNYYLDDSIVDLYDRRKQASYEKARSVRFSTGDLVERQRDLGQETETPLIWGDRLRYNVEPLLVNRVGTQALRPDARTGIPNMFLASDYVRTNTDLACMEGANEAARRAVNAILEATGSSEKPCQIWSFSTSEEVVKRLAALSQLGEAPAAVSGFFRTAGTLAGSLLGHASDVAGNLVTKGRKGR